MSKRLDYIDYLIRERARWEKQLAEANLANQGYADRYSLQIERLTKEIEGQLEKEAAPKSNVEGNSK